MDKRISALSTALELIEAQGFSPKKTLIESFFGVAPPVTRTELMEASSGLDVQSIGETATVLRDTLRDASKDQSEAQGELALLRPLAGLSFNSCDLRNLKRFQVLFGRMSERDFNALRLDEDMEGLSLEEVRRQKKSVLLLIAAPENKGDVLAELLSRHGFEEIIFPKLECSVEERIAQLNEILTGVQEQRDRVRQKTAKLAEEYNVILRALAFWEAQRDLADAAGNTIRVARSALITGWVRDRDVPALTRLISDRLSWCSVVIREPKDDEEPPVSIKLPALLKPMQLLVNMFGMPGYRTFDPTAYLTFAFLLFFGFCFGDVVYGSLLIIISVAVMRKYPQSWIKRFFQLFLYAGVSSIIFGLVTWTWMGDFLSNPAHTYVSADSFIYKFSRFFAYWKWNPGPTDQMLFDPLNKPLDALVLALALGVINQFYGLILKMKLEISRRDYAAAFFDAGLWLLVLPGVLLLIATIFTTVSPAMVTLGWVLFVGGAIGLVLTQGRKEKGILGKAITGVVSVYGILGSYGITAFIGDMLSYSRLLALGLTTTIIGMSFNIIANLAPSIITQLVPATPAAVGTVVYVLILVGGHAGNFVMSILGAFVHPARLILMEFFGRFYEAGGREFVPLGLRASRVELVERKCA